MASVWRLCMFFMFLLYQWEMLKSNREFGKKHSVVPKRLALIAVTVTDLCVRLKRLIVPNSR